jgi:hypothetical protein
MRGPIVLKAKLKSISKSNVETAYYCHSQHNYRSAVCLKIKTLRTQYGGLESQTFCCILKSKLSTV